MQIRIKARFFKVGTIAIILSMLLQLLVTSVSLITAQQEAQRAAFVVDRAIQEKQSKIVQAEGEAKAAQLISFRSSMILCVSTSGGHLFSSNRDFKQNHKPCCGQLAFFQEFFQGGNLLLCKFLLLYCCFRTKFQGGQKSPRGETASGGTPTPPVEESQARMLWCNWPIEKQFTFVSPEPRPVHRYPASQNKPTTFVCMVCVMARDLLSRDVNKFPANSGKTRYEKYVKSMTL